MSEEEIVLIGREGAVDFSRRLRLLCEPADFEEMLDRAEFGVVGQDRGVKLLGGGNAECVSIGDSMLALSAPLRGGRGGDLWSRRIFL